MNLPSKLENSAYFEPDVVYKINEIISFLEEKFPQSDKPITGVACQASSHQLCIYDGCNCRCHKPDWESDYAAIWERFDEDFDIGNVRQDVLELIRGLIK